MPGFIVKKNGVELTAVSVESLNVLNVRISGDVTGSELAVLEMSGGLYGHGKEDKHLIWISDHELTQDDEVEIEFVETISISHDGKTIDELFDSEQLGPRTEQPMSEMFKELANNPKLREIFLIDVTSPVGIVSRYTTSKNDYCFSCSTMWQWLQPEIAKVGIASSTLKQIEKRENGVHHANINLQFDESVKFQIGS